MNAVRTRGRGSVGAGAAIATLATFTYLGCVGSGGAAAPRPVSSAPLPEVGPPLEEDDGRVDRARLKPELHRGHSPAPTWRWTCHLLPDNGGVGCTGKGSENPPAWEEVSDPEWQCGGARMRHRYSESAYSVRRYDAELRLLHKAVDYTNRELLSLAPDGSGNQVLIEGTWREATRYGTPGDESTAITTHTGTEMHARALQGPEPRDVAVMRGEAVYGASGEPPRIVSGRWDFETDRAPAIARMCARLAR